MLLLANNYTDGHYRCQSFLETLKYFKSSKMKNDRIVKTLSDPDDYQKLSKSLNQILSYFYYFKAKAYFLI